LFIARAVNTLIWCNGNTFLWGGGFLSDKRAFALSHNVNGHGRRRETWILAWGMNTVDRARWGHGRDYRDAEDGMDGG
jgi:hypothetical protein